MLQRVEEVIMTRIMIGGKEALLATLIRDGQERSNVTLDAQLQAFLASTLGRRMARTPETALLTTLAEAYLAGQVNGSETRMLLDVGDAALILSGFFPTHAARRRVSPDYYLTMGIVSYHRLRRVDPKGGWDHIAHSFTKLVDVMLGMQASPPLDIWTAAMLADYCNVARRFLQVRGLTAWTPVRQ